MDGEFHVPDTLPAIRLPILVIPEWYAELLRADIGELPDGIFVPPLEVPIDERDLGIAAIGAFGI